MQTQTKKTNSPIVEPLAFVVKYESAQDEAKGAPAIRRLATVQHTSKERTVIINKRHLESYNSFIRRNIN